MRRHDSRLPGAFLLEPVVHRDDRGWFHEVSRESVLHDLGVTDSFVQENHSRSTRGTIRGLHFQHPDPQVKLVRCARGSILDVIVDLRIGSPTFGQFESWTLDDENCRQVYCPVGFAHGFAVTSNVADVIYRCSSYYSRDSEWCLKFDDPEVGIDWPRGPHLLSEKDRLAPRLSELLDAIPFRWSG